MSNLQAIPMEATEDPPIFIVGNGRTGTTLLRFMLSAHPRIYICHELWFYVWESFCPKSYDGIEFFNHWTRTSNFRWLRVDKARVLERLPAALPRERVAEAFRETMRVKAASLGKARYGDKTPYHGNELGRLFADFPDAKVIVMVRDPRSTVSSVGEMFWGSQRDLANCLLYERMRQRTGPFKSRVHQVRLEDLRADPRGVMQRVLEFVGEEWDDAVLDHPAHRADPDDMQPVYFLASAAKALIPGESRLPNLAPARIRLIEQVCAASMKEYGYQRAALKDAPGKLSTYTRAVSEVPETIRYAIAAARIAPLVRKPERWGSLESATRGRIKSLNPRFWREHPDFAFPRPPEAVEPARAAVDPRG